jgi:hypothetical protein
MSSSSALLDSASSVPAHSPSQKRAVTMGTATADIWPMEAIHDETDAILYTLVYADLFDYPLKPKEIHRYLTGCSASLAEIEERLHQDRRLGEHLGSAAPFWYLAGREHLVGLRLEREAYSLVLWRQAERYGRLIAAVPFVRMVSVTGSLAMNNVVGPQDDIDLLIVATKNRVWLARGLTILIVRLARRMGVELCPNYVLAEHRLLLGNPSLYIAHEMAQLVPVYGLDTYHRFLQSNTWLTGLLPNALPRLARVRVKRPVMRLGQRALEAALVGRLGDTLEQRERERKIPRLRRIAEERGAYGALYTPDLCKGHADDHAASVYQKFLSRLETYGVQP